MADLFDTPWDDLTVESVERFLAGAADEGLTWEAKSGRIHRDSVLKAVCGFANAVGGYLILGASRHVGSWRLSGTEFPQTEGATWASSVISAGVSPVPRFDAKAFPCSDAKQAVVVRVAQLSNPPCMTTSGAVYQRVSGQTLPVNDQRVLADLIGKGQAVRTQAEAAAFRAARRMLAEPGALPPADSVLSVGFCPVAGPANRSTVLFKPAFLQTFSDIAGDALEPEPGAGYAVQHSVLQDSLRLFSSSDEVPRSVTIAAFWDGSAAATLAVQDRPPMVPTILEYTRRFCRALAATNLLYEGSGDAHLVVAINPDHPRVLDASTAVPTTDVRRWTESRHPALDEIASVEREIQRGFGRAHWEP